MNVKRIGKVILMARSTAYFLFITNEIIIVTIKNISIIRISRLHEFIYLRNFTTFIGKIDKIYSTY